MRRGLLSLVPGGGGGDFISVRGYLMMKQQKLKAKVVRVMKPSNILFAVIVIACENTVLVLTVRRANDAQQVQYSPPSKPLSRMKCTVSMCRITVSVIV